MGTELIQGIAISIMVATVLAYLAYRLRQPLILGYILAGIIIGPGCNRIFRHRGKFINR